MTFDSWTAIVDDFIAREGFVLMPGEEDYVCDSWAGVLWVYAVFIIFGLLVRKLATRML